MSREEKIKELEGKIVAHCLSGARGRRCPHAKWVGGVFNCQVARRHCHSVRVRRWLAEIKQLEEQG